MIKAKNLHSALLMLVILMSGLGFAQIDSRNEGFRIEPSDSTQINADFRIRIPGLCFNF